MKYLGIDIGGTEAKMGIVNELGEVLCRNDYPVAFDGYETPIPETVLKSVDLFLEENRIRCPELLGIGISATGQIHRESGIVIGTAGHIKNWVGSPLKQEFERKYGLPVLVHNDANCVALGEKWVGRAKGCQNAIIITIGTGIGGGVIANSRLLEGAAGLAGELGHFSICEEGNLCTCGNRGCYEQYASMTALVALVKEAYASIGSLGCQPVSPGEIDGRLIFEWVRQGNKKIEALVNQWIDHISAGLVGLTHIFNPEIIILGGGVCRQEELFIAVVRRKVLERVMPRFGENLRIEAAALGNDAGIVGAVAGFVFNQ